MTFVRRMRLVSLLLAAGLILATTSADAQYKKQNRRNQERAMSGVVSSVETVNGMMTVRLDNGEVFAAPVERVRVRDPRVNEAAKTQAPDATANPAGRRRAVARAASAETIPVGSRVVVRRKLDRDGTVKRVVVRIVEQQ
jgi:hypothetical protein